MAASVEVIDQTLLPHRFATVALRIAGRRRARDPRDDGAWGAADWRDRGVRLLAGVARGSVRRAASPAAYATLLATRPTAINLRWALDARAGGGGAAARSGAGRGGAPRGRRHLRRGRRHQPRDRRAGLTIDPRRRRPEGGGRAGEHPDPLQRGLAGDRRLGDRAPRRSTARTRRGCPYTSGSTRRGRATRALNLTAWELLHHGVPHTCIVDNAGGHLMQRGRVDLVIVGSDRTTRPATSATRSART